ncbi:MAG TPA: alpha-L-arabinofuranosidase [Terriglobia bacterium]|nr:alpha-L-arabinofuranosidase [Terriglobia bacterium]
MRHGRRTFIRNCSALALGSTLDYSRSYSSNTLPAVVIDPEPRFEISPYLYMQFMEPLGITDSSVEAAWDYQTDDWRNDFVELVKELSPGAMRFGGDFSRYYKWREGVGPAAKRPAMRNYAWGGKETNRVGTHEFVDFSRRVGAAPFYCVNFLSDGQQRFWKTSDGSVRTGDAIEAADWVSYANDPDNAERRANGVPAPYHIKIWQLGNETSYGNAGFTKDQSIEHTIEFAKAMKQRDPSIQLIGWGDRGGKPAEPLWAADLLDRAGDFLDYVAIHMMQQHPRKPDSVLNSLRYQQEPEQAWNELLELSRGTEVRIQELEEVISAHKSSAGIAVTEGHLSLRPHNINPILQEWLTGVFHARSMNIYQRHGARVKIATACDFCGTRWTTNGVMLQVPRGGTYLMPVGSVMKLFKVHNGTHGVAVKACPSDLDVAASRAADRMFLHVANLNYGRSATATFAVEGKAITGGRVFEIAPENLRQAVNEDQPKVFEPVEKALPSGPPLSWNFPAGSVSVVELELAASA